MEAIVIGTQSNSITVWDFNGTNILSYPENVLNPYLLSFIKDDYVIAGDPKQSILKVWGVRTKESFRCQSVAPGKVLCLAVSPDAVFCATGVANNVYLWNLASFRHIARLKRHYQAISVLAWAEDGSFLISGGKDGLILVWMLSKIVSTFNSDDKKLEPDIIWSDHSLPITSIHVGKGGLRSRVYSCSLDCTCKVYDVSHRQLLLTFVLSCQPTFLVSDPGETTLFVACKKGHIHPVSLMDQHEELSNVNPSSQVLAHNNTIVSVGITHDGSVLITGSEGSVKLWNIASMQCMKTFPVKGDVTCLLITSMQKFKLRKDNRQLLPINIQNKDNKYKDCVYILKRDRLDEVLSPVKRQSECIDVHESESAPQKDVEDSQVHVRALKRANKELYELIVNNVIKDL